MLGEQWFMFRSDLDRPLTTDGGVASSEGVDVAESEVVGLVMLTQTCDIVRTSSERPFVEVSPVVEVDEGWLHEIKAGRRPNYAYIPALANRRLVADLDRVMTVEKSVVARWDRVEGWHVDGEARQISLALARKRARVAFPDDFIKVVSPLTRRLRAKHDKNSREGDALRALREIRVRAEPSWDSEDVRIVIWFVRNESDLTFEDQNWDELREAWTELVQPGGRFVDVQSVIVTLEDMTARDYVESDPLDLDSLTTRGL